MNTAILAQVINAFEDTYKKVNGLSHEWIKSDFCAECDGEGFRTFKTFDTGEYHELEKEQCEECERLHELEIKADIQHDIAKGN